MMMNRQFKVKAQVARFIDGQEQKQPPNDVMITGSFSYGHYDAAENYAWLYLPGYVVLSGGVHYNPSIRKFEAINHDIGYGATIWVEEL